MSRGANKVLTGSARAILEAFVACRGGVIVPDLLLDVGHRTEWYSFVLIDRHGLLGIDLQVRSGRKIVGSAGSRRWSATIRGAKTERFDNPLAAGARRVASMTETLTICGRRLAPGYTADLVVFAGADLSALKLSPNESQRVICLDDLADALEARYDFAVNPGALEPGEVSDIASLLGTLNRVDDPEIVARHAGEVGARRGLLALFRRKRATVTVSNSAAGIAPIASRLAEDRYPSVVAATPAKEPKRSLLPLLIPLLLAACVWWLWSTGGLSPISTRAEAVWAAVTGSGSAQQVPQEMPTYEPVPVSVTLNEAQRAFNRAAPELYKRTINAGTPQIESVDGNPRYTWQYLDKGGQMKAISLTFDGAGRVVGVSKE